MNRFFLEVAYMGTHYAGFQVQQNAHTVQAEIEKALHTLLRRDVTLTGSSRTDAGVHAIQNYFHFDYPELIPESHVYNLNALVPWDIAIRSLRIMPEGSHCRFHAIARRYSYQIYRFKDPFAADRAYYYPYTMDIGRLQEAAFVLRGVRNFQAFSKRRTQVQTYECEIFESYWSEVDDQYVFSVRGNRFLRGMVRGLVGTMLHVGRGKMSIDEFSEVIEARDSSKVDFSVPAKGLFLREVEFPMNYFQRVDERSV